MRAIKNNIKWNLPFTIFLFFAIQTSVLALCQDEIVPILDGRRIILTLIYSVVLHFVYDLIFHFRLVTCKHKSKTGVNAPTPDAVATYHEYVDAWTWYCQIMEGFRTCLTTPEDDWRRKKNTIPHDLCSASMSHTEIGIWRFSAYFSYEFTWFEAYDFAKLVSPPFSSPTPKKLTGFATPRSCCNYCLSKLHSIGRHVNTACLMLILIALFSQACYFDFPSQYFSPEDDHMKILLTQNQLPVLFTHHITFSIPLTKDADRQIITVASGIFASDVHISYKTLATGIVLEMDIVDSFKGLNSVECGSTRVVQYAYGWTKLTVLHLKYTNTTSLEEAKQHLMTFQSRSFN